MMDPATNMIALTAAAQIAPNLDRDLTVADLAAVACLSPCHFARMFKAVGDHAGQRRQRRAPRGGALPPGPDRDATRPGEIALHSGLSGQSTFTSAFKRATGCPRG